MLYGAVDRALNRARRNLLAAGRSDLTAPALLMHLDDGQIWLEMPHAERVDVGVKSLRSIRQQFGDMWLEWLRGELQRYRDTPTYNENIRQWAGALLGALDDSPPFERLCRDIPWLLLFGMLMAEFAKTATTGVAVATIIDMFRRPRAEREQPILSQPPALQQTLSKPSPGHRVAPRGDWKPELVFVPAGKFLMGSDPRRDKDAYKDEQPQRCVYLPGYAIGKYPVTNAQYWAFVLETGHKAPYQWEGGQIPSGKESHPVVHVSWHDVVAYCEWLARETGEPYRLPTEAEWEKAARGTDGRIWPWGDDPPTARLCNVGGEVKDTTPVGQYSPWGDSPYGCADMAGNVWEWTQTCWTDNYEQYDDKALNDPRRDCRRVVRGGAFDGDGRSARCACRLDWSPGYDDADFGFRVCVVAGGGGPIDSER